MGVNYDRISETYDQHRAWEEETPLRLIELATGLDEHAHRSATAAPLLEIGCGTGNVTQWLVKHWPAKVVALDASRGMLAKAAAKVTAQFVRSDARRLPFAEASFMAAVGSFVLHHLDSAARAALFSELRRIIAPGPHGGIAFVTSSHAQIRASYLVQWFPSVAAVDCERFADIDVLARELQDAGFSGIGTREVRRVRPRGDASFIDKARARFISTLDLIPRDELERGVAAMETQYQRDGHLGDVSWYATIIHAHSR